MSLSLSSPEQLDSKGFAALSKSGGGSVALLDKTSPTGFPSPCVDYAKPSLDLNEYLVRHPAASFYFTIDSNECEIASFTKGDKLLVDRSVDAQPGHIVIAVLDNDYRLKYLRFKNGCYELHSDLHHEQPIIYNNPQEQQFEAWGVVTAVIRKLKV